MLEMLGSNQPWRQLVEIGNVALHPLPEDGPLELPDGVRVESFRVPHRDELSDTVAFVFRGARQSVLFVPDTDAWEGWEPSLVERLADVDVALLDGSFYSTAELPGRDVSSIGHPRIVDTMDLLAPLVGDGRLRVYFTHLNHSNPALDPASPERADIERRGFGVLADGQEIAL